MRFGVLGPLAVWTDAGDAVTVPEAKVRALLANLLIHRGRPVSTDRLLDDLWGDDLPANPTGSLQAKVSQLRRALDETEPGSRELVVHQPPGYLLQVEADTVDADRFTALLQQADGLDRPPDRRGRAGLLAEALGLWRGAALADFADHEFARAAVVGWEEQRLAALEEYAEVRLALGDHRALTGELADLVEQHPLRERLLASHLLALYRSGRQSEALAGYDRARKRLRDELGLYPSSDLAALHLAILEQDPTLDAPSAPLAEAPALARHQLPAPRTDLIGRDPAAHELGGRVRAHQMLTLTGPGGVGKTSLALAVAREANEAFAVVRMVELAGVDPRPGPDTGDRPLSPDELATIVSAHLGLREDGAVLPDDTAAHPLGQLAAALHAQPTLLVLDNCEHLVETAAGLADALLTAGASLHILATSREPLGIAGEEVQVVPPLSLPDATGPGPLKAKVVNDAAAIRLFAARARAADPTFSVDDENATAVASICQQLDGLPLALELAASRLRVLGVHELEQRLTSRFGILTKGLRTAPARQRSLRAMIDWSWELLTASERIVLRRLALHADGCTLQAAEAVCSGSGISQSDVLDLLDRLVDRSLVTVSDTPFGFRYRLLESVAAYSHDRLVEADDLATGEARHSRYYTDLAEQAEQHLRGDGAGGQRTWLERLDAEAPNLRRALDNAIHRNDAELASRLAGALTWYWFLRGRTGEAHRSLQAVLALPTVDDDENSNDENSNDENGAGAALAASRLEAQMWLAIMAMEAGGERDGDQLDRLLDRYDELDGGATTRPARARWLVGWVEFWAGHLVDSRHRVEQALDRFQAHGDDWGTAAALTTRASHATFQADVAAMRRDGQASLAAFQRLGDSWGQLLALVTLADAAEMTGDYDRCAHLHHQGLSLAEGLDLVPQVSRQLAALGRVALLTGDHRTADERHEQARRYAVDHADLSGQQFAELGLALGARRQGRLDDAEAWLRPWLDWDEKLGALNGIALIQAELGFIAELRGDIDAALAAHGASLAAAQAIGDQRAVALALEGLAGAHVRGAARRAGAAGAADPETMAYAARLLGAAAGRRRHAGTPLPAAERHDVDRITGALSVALGPESLAAQLQAGASHDPWAASDTEPRPVL